jgi:hypothetical protein
MHLKRGAWYGADRNRSGYIDLSLMIRRNPNVTGGCKLAYVLEGVRWSLRWLIGIGSSEISIPQPSQGSIATNATLRPEPTAGAGFVGLLMGNGTRAPPPLHRVLFQ